MTGRKRLRINYAILERLREIERHANSAVDESKAGASFSMNEEENARIKRLIKPFMDAWIISNIEAAIDEIEGNVSR